MNILTTAFGPIRYEDCGFTVQNWEATVKRAAKDAWTAGVDTFVYTREMAKRDGIA